MEHISDNLTFLKEHWSKNPCWSGVRDGWLPLIARLHVELKKLDPDYSVVQVKEKYGGLRYYTDFSTDDKEICTACEALIEKAESESLDICEECGLPGKIYDSEWVHVACERCQREIWDTRHSNEDYKTNVVRIQDETTERNRPVFESLGLEYPR